MGLTKEERRKARDAQLEAFSKKYSLDPSLAAVCGGFRKDIYLFPEEVYCLPFSPESAVFIERECAFHRSYCGKLGIETPKFIKTFLDPEFTPFDISVISRVKGGLCPVMEDMGWAETRDVLLSFALAAAGWHSARRDEDLFLKHGSSFAPLSGNPVTNRWLTWLLREQGPEETAEWFHSLILAAVKEAGLDTGFLGHENTKAGWKKALSELGSLEDVVLHGDMHDGQIVLKPGRPEVTGVIDWDNFCYGNPLVDFNTSKWFPSRMWTFRKDFQGMREEMWEIYLKARGIKGQSKGGLNLFLAMGETLRVVVEKNAPKVWMTRGPYKEALVEYLEYLKAATKA